MDFIKKYILFSFVFLCSALSANSYFFIVLDADSNPIENATVTLTDTSTFTQFTETSSSNGRGTISDVPDGNYIITAYKENFAMAFLDEYIEFSSTDSFYLSSLDSPPTGQVLDSTSGLPIASATVYLNRNDTEVFNTSTDANGEYSLPIDDFGTNTFTVSVVATGYQSSTIAVNQSTEASDLQVSLSNDEAIIRGTITADGSGDPIEGALVSLQLDGQTVGTNATDSSGNYQVSGLGTNSYDFVVTADGYESYLTGVQTTVGDTTTFDVILTLGGGSITGTVTADSDGSNLSGIVMSLWLNGVNVQTTTTNSNGVYSFSNLGAGLYVIIAGGNEHEAGYGKSEVVGTDPQTINFSLGGNPGSISGVVQSGSNLLAGATVNIKSANITIKSIVTDATGAYSFTGLAPGTYLLYAIEDGYEIAIQSVDIQSFVNTIANFDLTAGGGTFSGTVEDTIPNPLEGAHIKITKDGIVYDEEIADDTGSYIANGLPTGTYDLIAGALGYQFSITSASVVSGDPATTVDFTLNGGGSVVSGTITDAETGAVIDEAVVEILDQGSNFFEYTVTKGNGDYTIRGLYDGTFVIQASSLGYITNQTDSFSVSGDVDKDLALYSSNPPTNNLVGVAYSNRSLIAEDRIHKLTWSPTTSAQVTGYKIFRNGEEVAVVSLDGPLEYISHNNPVDAPYTYRVTSINSDGSTSIGATVQLQ